jgi:hypothetical protein
MLRAGFGGLVLSVKTDERATWEEYCREAGRQDDLVIFGPDEPWRFNILDHELNRKGRGAGITENIVALLTTVLEVAQRNVSRHGGEDSAFWTGMNRQLLRNLADLLAMAKGRISIPDMYRAVISAPASIAQKQSEEWRAWSDCWRWLNEAHARPKSGDQATDFEAVKNFLLVEYPNLSEKTRSVVVATFTSMVDVLKRGVLRRLFSSETNLTPEATEQGKIILVDLPVKEFGEVGQFAQVCWKHTFARSIERRDVRRNPRPVFLWADEAQHFVTSYDAMFQATCRSSMVATVYLSQNISNFYEALGGEAKAKAGIDSLFANLNTKVFHANGDPETNEWAARLIGRSRQYMTNSNSSREAGDMAAALAGLSGLGGPGNLSAGLTECFEYQLQPQEFTRLRMGGPDNGGIVDGIVFQNGRQFPETGLAWQLASFKQRS